MTNQEAVRLELTGLQEHLSKIGDAAAQNLALERSVKVANARIERELHLRVKRSSIVCNPLTTPADTVIVEAPYDYWQNDYKHYGFLYLRTKPVVSIERVRITFGDAREVLTYPEQWIRLDKESGKMQVVPMPAGAFMLRTGGYFLPMITFGWIDGHLPQMFSIDYTAGIGDALDESKEDECSANEWEKWADVRLMRARLAAREVLVMLSNAQNAGAQSVSVGEDGLSESVSYTRGSGVTFGNHIKLIDDDWAAFRTTYVADTRGIIMGII